MDCSPPGFSVHGILQARTLEWVTISFSNAWKWKVKVKSLSRVRLFVTPWTAAYQDPPSMGFSGQQYWSGVPLPSPTIRFKDMEKTGKSLIWRRKKKNCKTVFGKQPNRKLCENWDENEQSWKLTKNEKRKSPKEKTAYGDVAFTRSTWSFWSSRLFMSSISSLSVLRASNRLLRRSCG